MKIVILKDGAGNPQGVIRGVAGCNERLYDRSGASIATYRRNVDFTYDNNGPELARAIALPAWWMTRIDFLSPGLHPTPPLNN